VDGPRMLFMRRMASSSGVIAGSSNSCPTAASRPSFHDSTVSCVCADELLGSGLLDCSSAGGVTPSRRCGSTGASVGLPHRSAARSCGRRPSSTMLGGASAWASQMTASSSSGASSTDSSTASDKTLRAPTLSREGGKARIGMRVKVAMRTEPIEGEGEGEQVEKSV